MQHATVLLIEDDPGFRNVLRDFLIQSGADVVVADNCSAAEGCLKARHADLAIVDYNLPDGNALNLLPRLKDIDPETAAIVLTGDGSVELAVQAMKVGAHDFLTKPVELTRLRQALKESLDGQDKRRQQVSGTDNHRTHSATTAEWNPFLGDSRQVREMEQIATKVARSDATILIQGESGTGKGVLARWLHKNGKRRAGAFVDLNCGALSNELLETELLGHQRGAFTGAVQSKTGLFEIAHRGTVFLDEIGDMPPPVQAKLLKVLEERRFRRLGDIQDRSIDIRLICATNRELGPLMQSGTFRKDLYFRISTVTLTIPPLRQRLEDIDVLASTLLDSIASDLRVSKPALSPEALQSLKSYEWRGNIRELRNVLERASLIAGGPVLRPTDFHFDTRSETHTTTILKDVEWQHIQQVLEFSGGRVNVAAQKLGISRSSLYEKLKQHRLGAADAN